MVTPWDVYWVLQLDSISASAAAVFIASVIGIFISGFMWLMEPRDAAARKMLWRCVTVGGIALAFGAFLPSSRTAAAMILVPKLTSPEVLEPVGKEAGELYRLAKSALKKLAADDAQGKSK